MEGILVARRRRARIRVPKLSRKYVAPPKKKKKKKKLEAIGYTQGPLG
jgi:hypothetical protein